MSPSGSRLAAGWRQSFKTMRKATPTSPFTMPRFFSCAKVINAHSPHATLPLDLTCRGDATGGDRWPHVRLQVRGSNPGDAPGADPRLARSTPWNPAPGRNPVSDLGRPKILRRGGPKLSRYKMRKPATASGRLAPLTFEGRVLKKNETTEYQIVRQRMYLHKICPWILHTLSPRIPGNPRQRIVRDLSQPRKAKNASQPGQAKIRTAAREIGVPLPQPSGATSGNAWGGRGARTPACREQICLPTPRSRKSAAAVRTSRGGDVSEIFPGLGDSRLAAATRLSPPGRARRGIRPATGRGSSAASAAAA